MLAAGAATAAISAVATAHRFRVIAYVTRWNPAESSDVGKIDTLIFAFAQLKAGRVVLDPTAVRRLHDLVALKAQDPALCVEVSIGGWGAGGFSEAASTASGRRLFARTAARLAAANGADGIDVDWEYPGHRESGIKSSPEDRGNFTRLLKDTRAALDRYGAARRRAGRKRYTLSVAVADGPYADHIAIGAVRRYVDWFNLMTYDFVNAMTATTGNHTGLYASTRAPRDARTADRAVRQFLAAGVPAAQLAIGAAFYGRAFARVRPVRRGLYQPYGRFQGVLPWPRLVSEFIDKNGYTRYWDAAARAPYLWNPSARIFITYEDPRSIAAKDAYVKAHGLRGVTYWEQSLDPGGTLLDAIYRGLR